MKRRHFGGIALACMLPAARSATPPPRWGAGHDWGWRRIEAASGGRLGVAVIDAATGAVAGHREGERFPMCSTFKWLAAACVLARVDAGRESLERRLRFEPSELVAYSPVTEAHAGAAGMTIGQLCDAAVTLSDNTAANLLLASVGGPPAVTRYVRSLGDAATRLDRNEPSLNEARPGDPRDTTTPAAMAASLRAAVLGDALSPKGRAQLEAWLVGSRTGGDRLRAGLPSDWRAGDKTGTGSRGTANDVAVLWPPGRPPIVVAAYLTGSTAPPAARNVALADVARSVAAAVAGRIV